LCRSNVGGQGVPGGHTSSASKTVGDSALITVQDARKAIAIKCIPVSNKKYFDQNLINYRCN